MRKCFMAIVLTVSAFMFLSQPVLAKTTLKMQNIYPMNGIAGQTSEYFADKVKEYSGGEIEIKVYGPGQLSGANELLSAVQHGMVDISVSLAFYIIRGR